MGTAARDNGVVCGGWGARVFYGVDLNLGAHSAVSPLVPAALPLSRHPRAGAALERRTRVPPPFPHPEPTGELSGARTGLPPRKPMS